MLRLLLLLLLKAFDIAASFAIARHCRVVFIFVCLIDACRGSPAIDHSIGMSTSHRRAPLTGDFKELVQVEIEHSNDLFGRLTRLTNVKHAMATGSRA